MAMGYQELLAQIEDIEVELAQRLLVRDEATIDLAIAERQVSVAEQDVAVLGASEQTLRLFGVTAAMQRARKEYHDVSTEIDLLTEQRRRLIVDLHDFEEAIRRERLLEHPPASTVEAVGIAELAADLEPLLQMADRFAGDDLQPADLRDAVSARATSLRGELRMYGDVPRDAVIVTRAAAFLITTLTPAVVDDLGPGADETRRELEAVQGGVAQLGVDETAVHGAEAMIDALNTANGDLEDPYSVKTAARRGLARWVEEDLFTKHVNHVTTAVTAGAIGVGANVATGGKVTALFRAARALMRARFPWIFP